MSGAARESAYEVLGVAADASAADIRRAFQRAALQHHPDRGEGADAELFRRAQQAWEVLGVRAPARATRLRLSAPQEPVRRAEYDRQERSRAGAPPASEVDLDDLRATPGSECYQFEHLCRCGGRVIFSEQELVVGASSVTFACPSCSLLVAVHYTQT